MANNLVWPDYNLVVSLNKILVDQTGEQHSVVRPELLESALSSPQTLHGLGANDIGQLAAKLTYGLAMNHCFIQGNKRTAFHAAAYFIERNDAILAYPDEDPVGFMVTQMVEHNISCERYGQFLSDFIIYR